MLGVFDQTNFTHLVSDQVGQLPAASGTILHRGLCRRQSTSSTTCRMLIVYSSTCDLKTMIDDRVHTESSNARSELSVPLDKNSSHSKLNVVVDFENVEPNRKTLHRR